MTGGLGGDRVLAVIRRENYDDIEGLVGTLLDAGISTLEFTLTGRGAIAAAVAAKRMWPEAVCGIGSVAAVADIEQAIGAGLDFAVAPNLNEEIVRAAAGRIMFVPGVLTPSEVSAAQRMGCTQIKLFPAGLGGPGYLRDLRMLFPAVAMLPSGGISYTESPAYLAAGASAVSLGSDLVGSVSNPLPLDEVGRRAVAVRQSVDAAPRLVI